MTRPLLPPRGIFTPSTILYHRQLPPTVIHTWIQLRGLAWGRTVTPPLRMRHLVELTHKAQASLYEHLTLLRSLGAIAWRKDGAGRVVFIFKDESVRFDHYFSPPRGPRHFEHDPVGSSSPTDYLEMDEQDSGDLELQPLDDSEAPGSGSIDDSEKSEFDSSPDSEKPESDPVQLSEKSEFDSSPDSEKSESAYHSEKLESDPVHHSEKSESDPVQLSEKPESIIPEIRNQVQVNNLVYSLTENDQKISFESFDQIKDPEQVKTLIQDQIKNNQITDQGFSGGKRECEGERGIPEIRTAFADLEPGSPTPGSADLPQGIAAYTSNTGLTPAAHQAARICREVTSLQLWQESLEHWQEHGWNPKNIAGILGIYHRGGASGCFICSHPDLPSKHERNIAISLPGKYSVIAATPSVLRGGHTECSAR